MTRQEIARMIETITEKHILQICEREQCFDCKLCLNLNEELTTFIEQNLKQEQIEAISACPYLLSELQKEVCTKTTRCEYIEHTKVFCDGSMHPYVPCPYYKAIK